MPLSIWLFHMETTLGSAGIHKRHVEISVSWVFSHMGLLTDGAFIKEVCFTKNIFLRGGSSITMGAQRSIITPELSLLSLVTLRSSNGYSEEELWWPRQRDTLQASIPWWITTLPRLICWYLGLAVIYTKKLWPDTEVAWGSLSGWLSIRQDKKAREREEVGCGTKYSD